MASQWASRRKLFYAIIVIGAVLAIIIVPLFLFFYKKSTCFDGVKNQNEKGIDCGGVCELICPSDVPAPIVLWQRAFEVSPGIYNVVVSIQNPNVLSRIDNIGYVFRLYDKNNAMITQRTGRTFLPANQKTAIFEAGIKTGARVPVRTVFEFTESPAWIQNSKDYREPAVIAENVTLADDSASPRMDSLIHNLSLNTIKTISAIAVIYDASDNAIAASRTLVENLKAQSIVPITFTWPSKFSGSAVRKEIILRVHPAGVAI